MRQNIEQKGKRFVIIKSNEKIHFVRRAFLSRINFMILVILVEENRR